MDATSNSKPSTNISSQPLKRVAPREDLNIPWYLLVARGELAYSNETQACWRDSTEDEQRVRCENIMRIAFYIVGVDPDDYSICLEACVEKAMSTKLLSTTAWTSWSGHKSLKAKMKLVQQYTDSTKQVHCPPAPIIMAAVALKLIRKVEGTGTDESTILIEQYKTFGMAPTAIHNYAGNEERLIRIMYKLVRPTTEQDEPITESLREVSLDVDSFRSSRHFEPGRRSNAAHRSSSGKPDDTTADNKIEERETLAVEVTCELTRGQAEDELRDILDLFKSKQDTSLQSISYPSSNGQKQPKTIESSAYLECRWILDKYTWTEVVERPMSTTWSNHPAFAIWNETKELVSKKDNPKRIQKRLDMLREILVREAFEKQDSKPLPDTRTQNQTAELRDEITAIKQNLESVQRHTDSLKRQNDEVIQLLKDEKRRKSVCVFQDQLDDI
ncbi:uncharacterized protein TrAFT101_001171 [Trichoderma asperellum]|uniref:Uncharacterized protein n=1 Tax=Trichoderma asperellum (strain ATCC 204424 / CBS 433.97 / NBRC 101777) TaxID=1042311 RepID=A0A2T3ZLR9_TRIA4|nr:hypothetical protein M441DRAFT_23889 [Trichoderma asperellum CBS 433.97]PTB45736.1 hypothetical protein M441DRAFT_23889 [Trichoderma asperellum CBS 433.97]UKZ85304.1 hypothetical protein TrAFT101_001171 [Trichoderma asperellum]